MNSQYQKKQDFLDKCETTTIPLDDETNDELWKILYSSASERRRIIRIEILSTRENQEPDYGVSKPYAIKITRWKEHIRHFDFLQMLQKLCPISLAAKIFKPKMSNDKRVAPPESGQPAAEKGN